MEITRAIPRIIPVVFFWCEIINVLLKKPSKINLRSVCKERFYAGISGGRITENNL